MSMSLSAAARIGDNLPRNPLIQSYILSKFRLEVLAAFGEDAWANDRRGSITIQTEAN